MIKLNLHTISWLLVALLVATSYFLFTAWTKEKSDSSRLYENAVGLNGQLSQLTALNGQLVSQNQVLRLHTEELEGILPEIKSEILNLRIKLSRTESYSETAFKASISPTVSIRDSLIYDTIQVKVFNYQDDYFLVKGVAWNDKQQLELAYRDTLIQVVYRGDRPKPWLWFFSKRPLMQRVSLKNPNARIHYSQVIQIEE